MSASINTFDVWNQSSFYANLWGVSSSNIVGQTFIPNGSSLESFTVTTRLTTFGGNVPDTDYRGYIYEWDPIQGPTGQALWSGTLERMHGNQTFTQVGANIGLNGLEAEKRYVFYLEAVTSPNQNMYYWGQTPANSYLEGDIVSRHSQFGWQTYPNGDLAFSAVFDNIFGSESQAQPQSVECSGIWWGGTDNDDNLIATPCNDYLLGRKGNDMLTGLGGSDDLFGGDGADLIKGGSGSDWIEGGMGQNTMLGGSGDDIINVIAGKNIFKGGLGTNTLIAGNGKDTFMLGAGFDSIWRFNAVVDRLYIPKGVTYTVTLQNFDDYDVLWGKPVGTGDILVELSTGGTATIYGNWNWKDVDIVKSIGITNVDPLAA